MRERERGRGPIEGDKGDEEGREGMMKEALEVRFEGLW